MQGHLPMSFLREYSMNCKREFSGIVNKKFREKDVLLRRNVKISEKLKKKLLSILV